MRLNGFQIILSVLLTRTFLYFIQATHQGCPLQGAFSDEASKPWQSWPVELRVPTAAPILVLFTTLVRYESLTPHLNPTYYVTEAFEDCSFNQNILCNCSSFSFTQQFPESLLGVKHCKCRVRQNIIPKIKEFHQDLFNLTVHVSSNSEMEASRS